MNFKVFIPRFVCLFASAILLSGCGGSPAPEEAPESVSTHIIDTHIHLYDTERESGVPWPPPDDKVLHKPHMPDEFSRVAKAAGVTGVVVVEASDRIEDNRWVLDQVADDPAFYVGLVGNIDPYRPDFATALKSQQADKRFVGIRARVKGKPVDFADPQVLISLRALAAADLTLDVLMNGEGVERIGDVDALARAVPNLRIVVNHVLGYNIDGEPPPAEWIAAAKKLGENPKVWCKISGLYQRCVPQPAPKEPEHYRALLDILYESFGPERLVYGSNWPCTKKSGDYASYVNLVQDYFKAKGEAACEGYFWKNAVEAYGLTFPAS